MASSCPVQAGISILYVLVVTQFHAAQSVYDLLQASELDLCHMIDFLSGQLLYLADQGLFADQLSHGIDLHVLVVHVHQGVAWNGNQ